MTPVKVLERVTHVAPLGIQFRDPALDTPVGDGLVVKAYRADMAGRHIRATLNGANVHVFNRLPGLSEAERGAGDTKYWQELTGRLRFVIEAHDVFGRFEAFRFEVEAPVRGLLRQDLFSSPARPAPAGMAVIRTQLRDCAAGAAASWAVVEAWLGSQRLARGITDDRGRVALIFAWPEPVQPGGGSPDSGEDLPPFASQTWQIELRALYEAGPRTGSVPELAATLAQRAANLWADSQCTEPLGPVTLRFGEELVVKSRGPGGELPCLFVTPPAV